MRRRVIVDLASAGPLEVKFIITLRRSTPVIEYRRFELGPPGESKLPLSNRKYTDFLRIVNPVSLSFISSSGRLNLLLLCFGSLLLFLLVNYSYFYTSLIAWRICSSIYGYSYSYLYFCSSIFLFFCWDVEVNLTFGWKLKIDEVKERSKFRPSAYNLNFQLIIWYAVTP